MEKIDKREVVVSVLNNVLESLFTEKEIKEEYSGDIVGNFGFGYCRKEKGFRMMGDYDELYDVKQYYKRLITSKENPVKVLNDFDWNFDESDFNQPTVQKAYKDTLKFYGLLK